MGVPCVFISHVAGADQSAVRSRPGVEFGLPRLGQRVQQKHASEYDRQGQTEYLGGFTLSHNSLPPQ